MARADTQPDGILLDRDDGDAGRLDEDIHHGVAPEGEEGGEAGNKAQWPNGLIAGKRPLPYRKTNPGLAIHLGPPT